MKKTWILGFLFALILSVLTTGIASAAPAAPGDFTITQPDGSTFSARQWGDEWNNGKETLDGYTIMQEKDGWWVYAAAGEDGLLAPALLNEKRMVVGLVDPPQIALHQRPAASPDSPMRKNTALTANGLHSQAIGNQPVLVLLASFSNRAGSYSAADFAGKMFGPTLSVKDYYQQASFNQLNLVPAAENSGTPNDGVIGWINLGYAHPNSRGSINNATYQVVKDALIAANSMINYASFDTNNDGAISKNELHIIVITAGYEASYGNETPAMWGHNWNLDDITPPVLDGKRLGDSTYNGGYSMFGETHSDHIASIGIMVHELGHDIDWPDLYDVDGSSEGVGSWSIMGSGSWNTVLYSYDGDVPALPDAFLKWYQGWIMPTPVNGVLTDHPIPQADANPSAFLFGSNPGGVDWDFTNHSGSGEYFLVENRQQSGFDEGLPGCGLLVWHVNERAMEDNYANASDKMPLVKLVQADGYDDLRTGSNRGDAGDPYPGSYGNTAFSQSSWPDSLFYNGSKSFVSMTNIDSGCKPNSTATLEYNPNRVFIPSVQSQGSSTSIIRNGNFEAGYNGDWIDYSSSNKNLLQQSLPGAITPHGGSWAAWMGQGINEYTRLVQQNINLTGVRYLKYWYFISSDDVCNYDFAWLSVNGKEIKQYDLCKNKNTNSWKMETIDLSQYMGKTVTLTFEVYVDGTLASNFILDDISVSATLTSLSPQDEGKIDYSKDQ